MATYEQQAQDFLTKHGIRCRITLSNTKTAQWDERDGERNHYRVTLSKPGKRIVFDFWGSIADAQQGKHPSAYDVLACASGDASCPESFVVFCEEYGYDVDSIKALQTFRRCSRFAKRLNEFFTAQELEDLAEIN